MTAIYLGKDLLGEVDVRHIGTEAEIQSLLKDAFCGEGGYFCSCCLGDVTFDIRYECEHGGEITQEAVAEGKKLKALHIWPLQEGKRIDLVIEESDEKDE